MEIKQKYVIVIDIDGPYKKPSSWFPKHYIYKSCLWYNLDRITPTRREYSRKYKYWLAILNRPLQS